MEANAAGLGSPSSTEVGRGRQVRSLRLPRTPNWRLQEARNDVGLSVEQLASAAELAVQTVYDTENGLRRPTGTTKERITVAINDAVERWNERIKNREYHLPVRRVSDLFPAPLVATR